MQSDQFGSYSICMQISMYSTRALNHRENEGEDAALSRKFQLIISFKMQPRDKTMHLPPPPQSLSSSLSFLSLPLFPLVNSFDTYL